MLESTLLGRESVDSRGRRVNVGTYFCIFILVR